MISIDFAKNVIAGKTDEMSKNFGLAMKRVLMMVGLFLVSPIVTFVMNLLGAQGVDFAFCVNVAKYDDLSQYEISYDLYNFDDVSEPNFSKDSDWTISGSSNSATDSKEGILKLAKKLVGTPYVWGGNSPDYEGGILWNDPELGIDWESMFSEYGIEKPITSEKDEKHLTLNMSPSYFKYNE